MVLRILGSIPQSQNPKRWCSVWTQMRMLRQSFAGVPEAQKSGSLFGTPDWNFQGLTKNYQQTEELKAARCLLKLPLYVPQCATNLTKALRPHSSQAPHARRVVIIMCTLLKYEASLISGSQYMPNLSLQREAAHPQSIQPIARS